MAEALCLVDSNILIRWVQPADPDVDAELDAVGLGIPWEFKSSGSALAARIESAFRPTPK